MEMSDRVLTHLNAVDRYADNAANEYISQIVLPYRRAHAAAFSEFQNTLAQKLKADQKGFELTLTALSLVGGGILTRVFALAAGEALAGKIAIDLLQRTNLRQALAWAKIAESSPTATYLLGEFWNEVSKLLGDSLAESFKPSAKSQASLSEFTLDPFLKVQGEQGDTYLEQFVRECRSQLFSVATGICGTSSSDDHKVSLLRQLYETSPFIQRAPTKMLDSDGSLQNRIELCLWMKFIMDRDYVWTQRWDPNCMVNVTRRVGISGMPISGKQRTYEGAQILSGPHYDQVTSIWSNDIPMRIGRIHFLVFGGPFFGESREVSAQTIRAAQDVLESLAQNSLVALKQAA